MGLICGLILGQNMTEEMKRGKVEFPKRIVRRAGRKRITFLLEYICQ